MLKEKDTTGWLIKFDSLIECADEVVAYDKQHPSVLDYLLDRKSFTGREFSSFQELQKELSNPWKKGLGVFDQMLKQLKDHTLQPPQTIKRQLKWNDEGGDELCLDRLRTGQPFWRESRRSMRPGPINVTILIEVGASAYIKADDMLWRGTASVVLSKLLETAGYRVEIWAVDNNERVYPNYNGGCCVAVNCKKSEDPLDITHCINAVSSWCRRILFFGAYFLPSAPNPGLGAPIRISKTLIKKLTTDEQRIVCRELWSEQAAVNWIKQQLEKFASGEFAAQP